MAFRNDSLEGLWASLSALWDKEHRPDGRHRRFIAAFGVIVYRNGIPVLRSGENIGSITDNGTGDMTVYFSEPLDSDNYAVSVQVLNAAVQGAPLVNMRTARSFDVLLFNSAGSAANLNCAITVVGGDP